VSCEPEKSYVTLGYTPALRCHQVNDGSVERESELVLSTRAVVAGVYSITCALPVHDKIKAQVENIFDIYHLSRKEFHAKPPDEKKVSFTIPK